MLMKDFGNSGTQVPVIGQGTWEMGDRPADAKREIEALCAGLDMGLTHIDTAEMYGNGRSERLVGKAIEGRREEVFLVSKVLPSHGAYDDTIRACESSLRRLGTAYLDLYLLHWWTGGNPIEETMRAMAKLVDDGKIRFAGVSNLELDEMDQAREALGGKPLVCNQVLYHLQSRGIEFRMIDECADRSVAIVAYSPLGQGDFPTPQGRQGKALARIADRHGKTPRQVALNFLTRQRSVFAIPKAARSDHVRENAGALGWSLTREDLALLDEAFPPPAKEVPLEMI